MEPITPDNQYIPLQETSQILSREYPPTFTFPLSKSRREALNTVNSERPSSEQVLKLLDSSDFIERFVGFHLADPSLIPQEKYSDILRVMEEVYELKSSAMLEKILATAAKFGTSCLPLVDRIYNDYKAHDIDILLKAEEVKKAIQEGTKPVFENADRQTIVAIKETESIKPQVDINIFTSGYPLLATNRGSVARSKLNDIKTLFGRLKQQFGDSVIGITVGGSIAKGFAVEGSDADICVFARNRDVIQFCRKQVGQLGIKHFYASESFLFVDENGRPQFEPGLSDGLFNPIFQGVFVGNTESLKQMQANHIAGVSDQEWEKQRKIMLLRERQMGKVTERFDVSPDEIERLQLLIALRRIPPPLEELKRTT